MIPKKQYDSFSLELVQENICRSRITFLEDENDLSNKLDIPSSSSRLRQFLPEDKTNWVLIGHSRGAAVAAYSSASMEPSKKPNALVLIDPVDDERSTTIEYIRTSHHFPRTYIVSTPFGGRSRYYKNATFESSCAPPSRSSSAFYETISTRLKDDSEAIATDYKDVVKGNKIEYVPEVVLKEYKNIGHLQLLNDRQGKNSLCPTYYYSFLYSFIYLIIFTNLLVYL